MELGANRDDEWQILCAGIEAGLPVSGLWHLEDELGVTVHGTAQLETGHRYRVREMQHLTGEVLGAYEQAEQQHAMEERMQRGMNIEAHRDEVAELMRIRNAHRQEGEMQARMEQRAQQTEPQPRVIRGRPFQVWVRGFTSTKLCLVHTVEELYAEAAKRFQVTQEFTLKHSRDDRNTAWRRPSDGEIPC
jgi:sensor c-di-GMP phosphodiesterase-like protein